MKTSLDKNEVCNLDGEEDADYYVYMKMKKVFKENP